MCCRVVDLGLLDRYARSCPCPANIGVVGWFLSGKGGLSTRLSIRHHAAFLWGKRGEPLGVLASGIALTSRGKQVLILSETQITFGHCKDILGFDCARWLRPQRSPCAMASKGEQTLSSAVSGLVSLFNTFGGQLS